MTQANTLPAAIEDPSDSIWRRMGRELRKGSDKAANEHLAAGHPIYYREADTAAGLLVKEYPDGRRELIRPEGDTDHLVRSL